MIQFLYDIMRWDPILKEQDWAWCPKSREEAIAKLHEFRAKDDFYTYWIEVYCKDCFVRYELLFTEGRYVRPDLHSGGFVSVEEDELPF